QPPTRGQSTRQEHQAMSGGSNLDLELSGFAMTDLGNAYRFVRRTVGRLAWCGRCRCWLRKSGTRWIREGAAMTMRLGQHECAQGIQDEAAALAASATDRIVKYRYGRPVRTSDLLRLWGRKTESGARMNAMSSNAWPYLERIERHCADDCRRCREAATGS